jgi:tetratricopeptide (TPR) repeat protein
MKATNLKQQKLQHLHQRQEERKLNNFELNILKKACFITCLFLCLSDFSIAQDWKFDASSQQAYNLVLNLQVQDVHVLIPEPKTVQEHYITSLAETLELLITEDRDKFNDYEDRHEKRLDRKIRINNADDLFLNAEIRLQWAFVYLKFGHEFDAALNLKEAYSIVQEIKKKYPEFKAIQKTSGILEVIVGSIPEKYGWVLSLMGIQGSIDQGLSELDNIRKSDSPLSLESDLLYVLVQGFVLQQTEDASKEMQGVLTRNPDSRLALFLGASISIKNSESEKALKMIISLEDHKTGLPLYYAQYLKGEIYLQKADYINSIAAYRWFINHYAGENYLKDAHYKIALCYWLNGNSNDAMHNFDEAKTIGKELTEADRYAARSLAENELPHIKLTKARYFTDGGYYEEAYEVLENISPQERPTKRDQAEFPYRQARLYHKQNKLQEAKLYYEQCIQITGNEPWYFAPNSCLQLGYIAMAEADKKSAKLYFEQALYYKKHEYKNSIDSKAKSALAQLSERK